MDVNIESMLEGNDENPGDTEILEENVLDEHLRNKVVQQVASASDENVQENYEGATHLGDFSVYEGYAVRTEDTVFPVAIANGSQAIRVDEAERVVEEFPEYFGEVIDHEDYDVGLVGDEEKLLEETGYEVSY